MTERRFLIFLIPAVVSMMVACESERPAEPELLTFSGPTTLEDFDEDSPSESVLLSAVSREQEQKIIRSGSVRLEVPSFDSAERSLTRFIILRGGYVSNVSRQVRTGEAMSGEIELRFPSEGFDSVVQHVRILGRVESERLASSDVTEEYIDLEARIATQQQLENRLLDLLRNRTGKLSELIEIEGQLASVREGIESAQGKLRHLRSRIAMSSLTVSLVEPGAVEISDTETLGGEMERALAEGVDGLVAITTFVLRLSVLCIPLLLVLWILYSLLKPVVLKRLGKTEG